MTHDARVSAWLAAWKRLEALNKAHSTPRNPIAPTVTRRILSEARIYTDLACAPEDVGAAAGEILHEEYVAEQELNRRRERTIRFAGRS